VVHELEPSDGCAGLLKLRVEDGGEEVDEEVEGETDLLHAATAVELVVDEEEGEVVSDEGDGQVDEVVLPGDDEGSSRVNDADEGGRENLGTVEEDVVGEPSSGGGNETTPVVRVEELERVHVVTADGLLLLCRNEVLVGVLDLVDTVVEEPDVDEEGETELDAERSCEDGRSAANDGRKAEKSDEPWAVRGEKDPVVWPLWKIMRMMRRTTWLKT
jgi:hypothetical protein